MAGPGFSSEKIGTPRPGYETQAVALAAPKIDNSLFKPIPLGKPVVERKAELIDVARQWHPRTEPTPPEDVLAKAGKILGITPNTDQNRTFITEALTSARTAYHQAHKVVFGGAYGNDVRFEQDGIVAKKRSLIGPQERER